MQLTFEKVVELDLAIGESPVWDVARSVLWFIDAMAPAIHCLEPTTRQIETWKMPAIVGSVGLAGEGRLVVALKTGVHLFDPKNGRLEFLVHPEPESACNRLNDGKVGPDGCFWVGSMHDALPRQPTAALYRVTPDGTYVKVLDGLRNSNGLAWSPDARTMYHADTRAPAVSAYDFDRTNGAISNGRILAVPNEAAGLPDGAAVDVGGNYWSAGISAGCLNVISPAGGVIESVRCPAPAPTMPCFGGEDLTTLFVTSLSKGQVAGALHQAKTDVPGLPSLVFGRSAPT